MLLKNFTIEVYDYIISWGLVILGIHVYQFEKKMRIYRLK
jgi:hypothetical protein